METSLKALIIISRSLQLYYHYCHNLVSGPGFHADHKFFGKSYKELEADYDLLVEYCVSMYGKEGFITQEITDMVARQLSDLSVEEMSAEEMYEKSIELEKEYQEYIVKLNSKAPLGLQNTVQDFATKSDIRSYKMKQRIA